MKKTEKTCKTCGITKDIDEFSINLKVYRQSSCKDCRNKKARERYRENREGWVSPPRKARKRASNIQDDCLCCGSPCEDSICYQCKTEVKGVKIERLLTIYRERSFYGLRTSSPANEKLYRWGMVRRDEEVYDLFYLTEKGQKFVKIVLDN